MSDAKNENDMDAPATRRELFAVRDELLHQLRSISEDTFGRIKALFYPFNDVPRRMTDAEARLDALEQRPTPRKTRRRSG